LSDGSLEASPILRSGSRGNRLSELGKPHGVSELKMSKAIEIKRSRILGGPRHGVEAVSIAPLKVKRGIQYHKQPPFTAGLREDFS
jgi:hypothetical protein